MKNLKQTIVFFFVAMTILQAQPEEIYVQTDKGFYVTGEDAWYKISFLNTDTSELKSKIIHLDWVSPKGKVVKYQRLSIEKQSAKGDLTIPLTWKEGYYTLRAYTQLNLNYSSEFIFQKKIPIYNEIGDKGLAETVNLKTRNTSQTPQLKILKKAIPLQINLDKTIYKKREKIKIPIIMPNQKWANLSVKVYDINSVPQKNITSIIAYKEKYKNVDKSLVSSSFTAQNKLTLKGNVYNHKEKINVGAMSIFMNEAQFTDYVKSTVENGFETTLPLFYGLRTFQFNDLNPWNEQEPKIELTPLYKQIPTTKDERPLERTGFIKDYLRLNQKRNKIKQLFGIQRFYAATLPPINNQLQSDKTAILEDYIAFTNLEEFIKEVFTYAVKIKTVKKQKTFRMINLTNKKYFPLSPLYLVDGFITYNEQAIMNMDIKDIEEIHLFSKVKTIKEQFGPIGKYGVFSIKTKSKKALPKIRKGNNIVLIEGLYPARQFQSTDYTEATQRTPDLRSLVYWNPTIELDENGKGIIEFSNTDVVGDFQILIEGVTKQSEIVIGEGAYKVE